MQVQAGLLMRYASTWFGSQVALTGLGGPGGPVEQTFTGLNHSGNRFGSGLLALGAQREDRVGVLGHNTAEVLHAWLGCEKHNLVRVVLHSHFGMDAHAWSLDHVEASTLAFDTRFAEQVAA